MKDPFEDWARAAHYPRDFDSMPGHWQDVQTFLCGHEKALQLRAYATVGDMLSSK